MKDFKVLIVSLVGTFLIILGFAYWQSGKSQDIQPQVNSSQSASTKIDDVKADPEFSDYGDVDINGGLVTREYKLINETEEAASLRKIATSCMCTQAKVSSGGKETRLFGMEHNMDKNPPVNLEINPGEEAVVTVIFDPAAHGPQGTGPFDRTVWLTFSQPNGVKEIRFSGTVVAR